LSAQAEGDIFAEGRRIRAKGGQAVRATLLRRNDPRFIRLRVLSRLDLQRELAQDNEPDR